MLKYAVSYVDLYVRLVFVFYYNKYKQLVYDLVKYEHLILMYWILV